MNTHVATFEAAPGRVDAKTLPTAAAWLGALSLLGVFLWSAQDPCGRFTWWLESTPVLLGIPAALLIHRRVSLTPVSWGLVWLASIMMLVGAHYTFAEVPLGDWIRDAFAWDRNPYDRLGHVFQGVLPAMLGRELLLRCTPLRRGAVLFTMSCCIALSVSAFYELVECWVGLLNGESAADFLGTQGDVWDPQWDMSCALAGAILAQLGLARWQDRCLRSGRGGPGGPGVRARRRARLSRDASPAASAHPVESNRRRPGPRSTARSAR